MTANAQLSLLVFSPSDCVRAAARAAGVPGSVLRTLDLMVVAEEEVAQAGAPTAAFALLLPGALVDYQPGLYRAHCQELLERIELGEDTRPGTRAEVLAAMMVAAGAAPLGSEGLALVERLFGELLPVELERLLSGRVATERWEGQVDADLVEARRKLAKPWRELRHG